MANSHFHFKQFTIHQDRCAMKVTTDACLFGAWVAEEAGSQKSGVRNLLDIGTGTGLLALMYIQKNPKAKIDTIEIDNDASEQAKENVEASPWKDRITIINADARTFLFPKKYDLIISNPPFYEKEIKSISGSKNLAHHCNKLSLKELLAIIRENLSENGNFFLLQPFKRNEETKKLLKDHQLQVSKILFVRQSVKHDYFRIMIRGKRISHPEEETEIDEISIWDDKENYTSEFVSLLKEYYLKL
jgi:tRNA1Val (adenine37-N6)-methyltransferase